MPQDNEQFDPRPDMDAFEAGLSRSDRTDNTEASREAFPSDAPRQTSSPTNAALPAFQPRIQEEPRPGLAIPMAGQAAPSDDNVVRLLEDLKAIGVELTNKLGEVTTALTTLAQKTDDTGYGP